MAEQITVCIPFEPNKKLAVAYNRAMRQAKTNWVLLLDWDLFMCNPYWYAMCQNAIEQVGTKTGWITCVTNRIGAPQQREFDAPKGNDVADHILYAKQLFKHHSRIDGDGKLIRTQVARIPGALSGFFILTNKRAWKKCGGFDETRKRLLGVDNRYSRALSRAGYAHYYMPGLYYYHIYGQKNVYWSGRGAGLGDNVSP